MNNVDGIITSMVFCAFLIVSCTADSMNRDQPPTRNPTVTAKDGHPFKGKDSTLVVDHTLLEGAWWLPENEISALFLIASDSLYYTEMLESPIYISLSRDTLKLINQGLTTSMKIKKLNKDTLILYDLNSDEATLLIKK